MDKQEKLEWYQLGRELAREQSSGDGNCPREYEDHDPVLEYGLLSTCSSEQNVIQNDLSSRRLSELSDTLEADGPTGKSKSEVDFQLSKLQDSSGMRLNLRERIDGEIAEGNHNVHFDANLSPISLADDILADINNTDALLKRAQEENWISFFSSKEEDKSWKDAEWHSLQSGIMQDISRPEPLGYSRCDSGIITGNKSVTFANELPIDYSCTAGNDKSYDFIPLENKTNSLDISNREADPLLHVSGGSNAYMPTPLSSREDGNINSVKENLEKKMEKYSAGSSKRNEHAKKVTDFYSNQPKQDRILPSSAGAASEIKHTSVGSHNVSIKAGQYKSIPRRSLPVPIVNTNELEGSYLVGDIDVRENSQTDSQASDKLFVPHFENTSIKNQSIPESFLQSLSDSGNSLKSDIQKLFVTEMKSSKIDKIASNSLTGQGHTYSEVNKFENNSLIISSDLGTAESDCFSVESTIQRKISFSAKKRTNIDILKEFETSKPNITSSIRNGSIPSYSISSSASLQSTLGSGSFSIRKVIDEKIEFSHNIAPNTDKAGVLPQFSLTSMSSLSGEEKLTLANEEGTIPSGPSSFTDPSYKNISNDRPESSVSKLLGSTFKKTEKFLKKLERLDLPGQHREYIKADNSTGISIPGAHTEVRDKTINANTKTGNNKLCVQGDEETYVDEEDKLHFTSLSKYEDADGELLQLSDDEILVEQDIESASLVDPYISDTTPQSCSGDGSQLSQLDTTKMLCDGLSKLSGEQISSEEELTLTDLELDKKSSLSITLSAPSGNLDTIREVLSPEKGNTEKKIVTEGNTDTSVGIDTPRYMRKHSRNVEKKIERVDFDVSTSSESDISNRRVKRVPKLHKQTINNLTDDKTHNKVTGTSHNNEPDIYTFAEKSNSDVTQGEISLAPQDSSASPPNQNLFDDSPDIDVMPKQVKPSDLETSHGNPSSRQHGRTAKTNRVDKRVLEYSRNDLLESSISNLLNEYERPVHGKFSDSPLIRKLELLSKILREAKLKGSHSYTSDSSDASLSDLSQNQTNIGNKKGKKDEPTARSTHVPSSHVLKDTSNEKTTHSRKINSENAKSKVSVPIASDDKTVIKVCPNCRRRDVGTNCPTPCISSDESARSCTPLTVQTWTQTNEQGNIPNENVPHKKVASRKRWSDKENSSDVDGEIEQKDEQKKGAGKRERKNTFVVTHPLDVSVDVESNSEKVKGTTAWFQSFRSDDDSESVPLGKVPDLTSAYSESRSDVQHGTKCEMTTGNKRMGLQEAFILHRKDFISNSSKRLQDVKDGCLLIKHPQLLKETSAKNIVPGIQKDGAPKKITKTYNPETTVKKVWVPQQFSDMQEEKLREKRSNRLKMKSYDLKTRRRFLKRTRTRTPNSRNSIYFIERH